MHPLRTVRADPGSSNVEHRFADIDANDLVTLSREGKRHSASAASQLKYGSLGASSQFNVKRDVSVVALEIESVERRDRDKRVAGRLRRGCGGGHQVMLGVGVHRGQRLAHRSRLSTRLVPNQHAPMTSSIDLASFVRAVPDFPQPGILFRDVTPLLHDPVAFASANDRLAELARG